MSTTLEGLPGAPQPRMGEPARFLGVLIGPRATFGDIDRKPSFLLPLVVWTVLSLFVTFAIQHRVGVDRIIRQSIEQSNRAGQLSAEQIDQAVERSRMFVSVLMWAGALVAPGLLALLASAVYLALLNMMEAGVSFQKVFGVTVHAFIPAVVAAVLTLIVIFLKDPEDINLQNPLGSNLAIALDPHSSSKALYALANSVDLFSFWTLALLALGFSVITKKFSFKKSAVLVVIPWLIYVLGKVGLAAIRG